MATQDTRSILFTNTQPQQGFRLLEIPPELDELLSSKNASVYVGRNRAQDHDLGQFSRIVEPTNKVHVIDSNSSHPHMLLRLP